MLLNDGKNVLFLEKNIDLLKIDEICEPIDESLLDNPTDNKQKINNMIFFYKDFSGNGYKKYTPEEKKFLLATCKSNVEKLERFKISLNNRKNHHQQKLFEFKREINGKLNFLNNTIFSENKDFIIQKYFLGHCSPYFPVAMGNLMRDFECSDELKRLFDTETGLYNSVQAVQNEYQNNQEFKKILLDYTELNHFSEYLERE